MLQRITIMIDEDIEKILRLKQAKLIKNLKKNVSFSRVINDTLREGLKKIEKKSNEKKLKRISQAMKKVSDSQI